MRRKKDAELARIEKDKIDEKEAEKKVGEKVMVSLKTKADIIEKKVLLMQKFEGFLEKVKEQHPDEFQELNDIVSRFRTLEAANKKLQES